MAEFTWFPDASVQKSVEPAIRSAKFGDGYGQDVPAGINNMPEHWSLTFTGGRSEIDAIDAFLKARGATEAFDWKTPDEVMARFVCRKWSKGRERGVKVSLSCEFEQVFGR